MIYKIVCKDVSITNCYVGSTTNISMRRSGHRAACNYPENAGHNYYIYDFIRDNGGWRNWDLILIEHYAECTSGEEARKRERFWMEEHDASFNTRRPYISPDEKKNIDLERIFKDHRGYPMTFSVP